MMQNSQPHIIGIAGTFAGGKDTLAKYLAEHFHYEHFSTGDMVRVEAQKRYGSIERPILRKTATELRHDEGAGVFAQRALEHAKNGPLLISGIRSLGERDAIVAGGGTIMFIDAPVKARYERMKARARDDEMLLTLEQFEANEAKEWYSGDDPADFNLRDIKRDADIVIENDADLQTFMGTAVSSLHLTRE
ncbi:MAG TPA: AAA family ATPase [Candidatus Saccharimonadales bacterium]|jgi:dephospho-CoA kinase|nr:AAA family ATPase [Candidatus Saccharimonadales bacterium]